MKVTWLGHSSFLLEESTGTKIVTDPYRSYVGYEMPRVSADVVTVSHEHNDHNNVSAVGGEAIVLNTQGFFEVKGVHVRSLETSHDDADGEKRGKNLVFQFRMDGVELCHMGDIGEDCTASIAEALVPVNILMIPIGGTFTISAEQAKEYVDKLMPDVVIPMHFKTKDCKFDIAELDDFLDLFDRDEIDYLDVNTVEFDRNDFDGESTRVLVFSEME